MKITPRIVLQTLKALEASSEVREGGHRLRITKTDIMRVFLLLCSQLIWNPGPRLNLVIRISRIINLKPNVVVHAYNLSYSRGGNRRIEI
jgi:hypothetical protein